jgi:hypothetical protein
VNRFLAGSVAGLSVLALDDPSRRRTLALYLLTRLAQVVRFLLEARSDSYVLCCLSLLSSLIYCLDFN